MKKTLFTTFFFLVILSACNKIDKENFDYGKTENGIYKNDFFGLEMPVPQNWVAQNQEQTEKIAEIGVEALSGDDKTMKASLNASEVNTAYLMTLFKYEQGAPVPFNPSFMLVAENIKLAPGVKSGKDYLYNMKKLLSQGQMNYEIEEAFTTKEVSGKTFDILSAKIVTGETTVYQQYLTSKMDDFAFSIIVTYSNDEEKDALYKMVESMTFK